MSLSPPPIFGAFLIAGTGSALVNLFVYSRLCFAPAAIIFDAMRPVAALKRSWELTKPCTGRMMLFLVGGYVLIFVAVLLCCLPVLFVTPVLAVSIAVFYRDLAGLHLGGSQTFETPYPRQYGAAMPGYGGPPVETPQNPFPSPFESPSTPPPGDEPPRPNGPPPVPPPGS